MHHRRPIHRGCRAALAALALLAATPLPSAHAQEVPIDVILSTTGNAAFLGQMRSRTLAAMQTMINDQSLNGERGIGGKPVRFLVHDDQTSPQVTVQITSSLVAARPPVVIGASISGTCAAELPMIKAAGPVAYCLSPGIHPPEGSYMFSAGVSTHDLARVVFRYALARGWTRIATITSSDTTGQEMDEGLDAALKLPEFAAAQMVARARFNIGEVSMTAQIERIRDAHPQMLIVWSTGTAVAGVFKAMIQADLDVPVVTSNGNMSADVMRQFAGFLPKDLLVPAPAFLPHDGLFKLDPRVERKQQDYYAAMRAAGLPIDLNTAGIWDPTLLVVEGLRTLGTDTTPAKMRAWLATLHDFPGITGLYDFPKTPQRGVAEEASTMSRWDAAGDRWVPVAGPRGVLLN